MKLALKIKLVAAMLLITLPIYSQDASYVSGTLNKVSYVDSSSSVEFSYTPTSADVFEIGFSKNPITDLATVVQAADEYNTMSIAPGTFKGLLSDVYIYWKIITPSSLSSKQLDIYVTTHGMVPADTTSTAEHIPVTLKTERSDSSREDDGILSTITTSDEAKEDITNPVLDVVISGYDVLVGSQKITIETGSFYGKTEKYKGELFATIIVGN